MHHDYSYRVRRERRNQPVVNSTDRVIFGLLAVLLTFFAFVVLPLHHIMN